MKRLKELRIFRIEILVSLLLTVLLLGWTLTAFVQTSLLLERILNLLFLLTAIIGSISAYLIYFRDIKREKIVPDRWSWLIWGLAALIEALTYQALNDDLLKSLVFMVSAGACILITIKIWTTATWKKPDWTETLCTLSAISSIALWLIFNQTFWAHMLVIAAVPVAFIPTWRGALKGYEFSLAWSLWTISDIATLAVILMRFENIEELPYILVELACHATVWLIIFWRARNKINLNTVIPL